MNSATITLLNYIVHSLVIGAVGWLLVRWALRDPMRRCILANLVVLMCLYIPFDISMRDLFPPQRPVPVLTPLRETFEADWRVSVAPVNLSEVNVATPAPTWDVNDVVKTLRWIAWLVTAVLLIRLLVQSIRVQRWAWRLRYPSSAEYEKLPADVNPERIRVFDGEGTPCAAGWFFPVIAVPAAAFEELTPRQWRWLIRHESEHLRCSDTVAVLLQNIVRALLWWNPFIHALIEEYAKAREEACDAAAVGEDRDQSDYADFLLAWAAKAAPQPSCMMPIARSRPARRLKARLVALMEARGVRKKLGALFVLACVAFAIIAPFFAASFGIATAAAQEVVKPKVDEGAMFTRVYRVAPDFLATETSAEALLAKQGILFPEGARALFQPATSQLIVRHTKAALDQIEAIVDRLHHVLPQVYFQCKMIQGDRYFGSHEGILTAEAARELIRSVSQQKGIDLMSAPSVTTKLGQGATVEVVREVLPTKPDTDVTIATKFVGPSLKLIAKPAPDGKVFVEAKIDLGVNLDGERPWLLKAGEKPVWDRVQIHTASAYAELASGETLVLHLPTTQKPVTVLVKVEALNPEGTKAVSFDSTATMQPSSTGIVVPDKPSSELAVRVYKVPQSFPQDQRPFEMLKAAGVDFPEGAGASLNDEKLIVRNTKANLELIQAWLDAMIYREVKKSVHLTVHVAEMKGDLVKQLSEWLQSSTEKVDATQTPAATESPPITMGRQFTVSGIFTQPQFEKLIKRLATDSGAKVELLKPNPNPPMYVVPVAMGGQEMKIEPVIGPDGNAIEMIIRTLSQGQNPASGISTSVTIWDGQTVVLGSQPSKGVSRILFITGYLIDPSGIPAKK